MGIYDTVLPGIGTYTADTAAAAGGVPIPTPRPVYSPASTTTSTTGTGGILDDSLGKNGLGLGWNMDTAKLAFGGLEMIGNLWQAYEANKVAKDRLKMQKEGTNINLANQIQAYNTQLEGLARSRYTFEGKSPEAAQSYIDTHQLEKRQIG